MVASYLAYNATAPVDPAALQAMLPYLREEFGKPSSAHVLGRRGHDAVAVARGQVADLLGARPDEIVFTGGGTEASNHAIKGTVYRYLSDWFARWRSAPHVVISSFEHPATAQPCAFLRRLGCKVTEVPADRQGLVDPHAVSLALTPHTVLVSVMHSNNEAGTLQPIKAIAALARSRRGLA